MRVANAFWKYWRKVAQISLQLFCKIFLVAQIPRVVQISENLR